MTSARVIRFMEYGQAVDQSSGGRGGFDGQGEAFVTSVSPAVNKRPPGSQRGSMLLPWKSKVKRW
jgi:hypothetical protein